MPEFKINVTTEVTVKIPEGHWTTKQKDRAEWAEVFYDFSSVEEHAEHLAQLISRGVYTEDAFIEGYGVPSDEGIEIILGETDTEIESTK